MENRIYTDEWPVRHYLPDYRKEIILPAELSVAVLLPVHNGELFIEQAIKTVMDQSHERIRLIIINDSSTDATLKIANRLQKSYLSKILIISCNSKNQASALNLGLEYVNEEFVALLDVDDVWKVDKIKKQLVAWCDKPVGLHVTDFTTGAEYTEDLWVSSWDTKGYERVTDGYAFPALIDENFILRSSALIPITILREMAGFDQDISGSDDRDLWLRISEKYPIGILRHVLCFKYVHDNAMSRSFKSNFARRNLWLKWTKRLEKKSEKLLKIARHNVALFTYNYGYMHYKRIDGDKITAVLFFLKSVKQNYRPVKSTLLAGYNFVLYVINLSQYWNNRNA